MGLSPFRSQTSHFLSLCHLFCKMKLSTSFFLNVLLDLPVRICDLTGCLNSLGL